MTNIQLPDIPNATRAHWSHEVQRTCLMHAENLRIIGARPEGAADLNLLPGWLHERAFGICQDVIRRACEADLAGYPRDKIGQKANAELWNQLTPWRQDGHSDFVVTQPQANNV
jgi:hypothetical protein